MEINLSTIVMLMAAFLAGIVLFVVTLRVIRTFKKERLLADRRKTTSLHIAKVVSAAADEKRDETAPGVSVIVKTAEASQPETGDGGPAEDTAGEPADDSVDGSAGDSADEPDDSSAGEPSVDKPADAAGALTGGPDALPIITARHGLAGAPEDVFDEETRETQAVSLAEIMAPGSEESEPEPAAAAKPAPAEPAALNRVRSMHMQPIQPLRTLQPVDEQESARLKIADIGVKKLRLPEAVKLKERKVLLVEDVKVHRELIEMYFEGSGVKFEFAGNGMDACDMFLSNPDGYSLILMDINMPVMNGYDAARKIRALDVDWAKQIPIVAITANATEEDISQCFEAGMDDHIVKPIDMEALQEKVFEFITRDSE